MTWFFSIGQPLWPSIIFKTVGKIPYVMLGGNHMPGCQFTRSPQLQQRVRRNLYTETYYSFPEATLRRVQRMGEVNKMPMDLRIAS